MQEPSQSVVVAWEIFSVTKLSHSSSAVLSRAMVYAADSLMIDMSISRPSTPSGRHLHSSSNISQPRNEVITDRTIRTLFPKFF